jgi:hypothetical protein
MLEVPLHIVPPLAAVVLGALSYIIRWIAGFQLEGAGSDFALIASSLQLSLIFSRIDNTTSVSDPILSLDILLFVFLLCLWSVSIKTVKKALENQKRYLGNRLNLYTFVAFVIGTISLSIELIWRWLFV